MRTQNTENSEKENSETKQEIRTKREVNKDTQNCYLTDYSRSSTKVFLGKGILEIFSKFTGEQSCQRLVSIKLQSNFIEFTHRYGCSPVNLLHNFRTPLSKNTSGGLLLRLPS